MLAYLALLLGAASVIATVLPFVRTDTWWVRACDYPKPQLAILCFVSLVLWLTSSTFGVWATLLVAAPAAVATLYNLMLIAPFTPLWKREVADASSEDDGRTVKLLMSNVQMGNRDFDAALRMIEEADADLVFLAETDQAWVDAMAPAAERYPHVVSQPQENFYGLMFMTRLDPVEDIEIRFIFRDDTPSIRATLKTGSGHRFVFYGLHPEPPQIGENSDQRDAELMIAGREVKEIPDPVIIGGDLNDVAWSHTTRLFRRISGTLDPRIGRGLFSSFHAQKRYMRWPLDHLFHTPDFEIEELGLLPEIGSDHFPVRATLRLVGDANVNGDPDAISDDDRREADRMIEDQPR